MRSPISPSSTRRGQPQHGARVEAHAGLEWRAVALSKISAEHEPCWRNLALMQHRERAEWTWQLGTGKEPACHLLDAAIRPHGIMPRVPLADDLML
jgi:hypothetical protein